MLKAGEEVGREIHALVARLMPLNRSITGTGVRNTLSALQEYLPDLDIHEVPSGTSAFDWTVPQEWTIREAWLEDSTGTRIVDFRRSNLHVVGYSEPVDLELSLDELQTHLHSIPERPDAIPYVTSYYERTWGFCVPDSVRKKLTEGTYRAYIDSTLADGHMTYADILIRGKTESEILLSTYVCHPSMANNELSGPCVTAFLGRWIKERPRHYTYRIVFAPETIGALVYLGRHLWTLKSNVKAGFVVTCIGDDRAYSFLPSRSGETLADRAARHALRFTVPEFKSYRFLDRGSDERQYCSPGVDLPVCSVMRSKYGEYPEYHTSDDNLSVVTPEGLAGGFEVLRRCIESLENNATYHATTVGEPQLGRYGLYPSTSTRRSREIVLDMLNILAYADGDTDLLALADMLDKPIWDLAPLAERLEAAGLLRRT